MTSGGQSLLRFLDGLPAPISQALPDDESKSGQVQHEGGPCQWRPALSVRKSWSERLIERAPEEVHKPSDGRQGDALLERFRDEPEQQLVVKKTVLRNARECNEKTR